MEERERLRGATIALVSNPVSAPVGRGALICKAIAPKVGAKVRLCKPNCGLGLALTVSLNSGNRTVNLSLAVGGLEGGKRTVLPGGNPGGITLGGALGGILLGGLLGGIILGGALGGNALGGILDGGNRLGALGGIRLGGNLLGGNALIALGVLIRLGVRIVLGAAIRLAEITLGARVGLAIRLGSKLTPLA